MTYKIDFDRWTRFFNVPCSLVDRQLRLADGDFVKVILCVYSGITDSLQLAQMSGISEARAKDAIHYWADLGVIKVEGIAAPEGGPLAVEASAAAAPAAPAEVRAPAPKPEKSGIKYSPKELANKLNESEELRYLVSEYERIKGSVIKDNELLGLINLNEYYGFDSQSLMLMIEYCHLLGKDRIGYLEKVARDWFDRDIVSYKDVEAEIMRQSTLKSYERKAVKALCLKGKPSTRQAEIIQDWQSKGISIEMLMIAYDRCMDTISEPNFNYIAKIVNSWFDAGLKTAQAVREKDSKSKPAGNQTAKNQDASYDLDEWEKFAMSFDPEGVTTNGKV